MTGHVRPTPYSRTRRQLPERIERLRWLRQAVSDPEGCTRETEVDDAVVRVVRADGGQVEMRVDAQELSQRLADEFFGRRYKTHVDDGVIVFVGRPV
jgi:hypothetical protein